MPNHYTTELTITGSHTELEKFQAAHLVNDDENEGRLWFDFRTVIPQPDFGPQQEIIPNSGIFAMRPGEYEWCVENWGTKWNSYNFEIKHNIGTNGIKLVIQFETAWAPPVPVLQALVKRYPELVFKARGKDEFEHHWRKVA